MKKILVILLMLMPVLASAQSTFTVESNGVKYSFPLEGTTITITDSSDEGNDDDPSEGEIRKKIVGSWRTVHVKGWIYDDDGNSMYVDKDVQEGVEWGDENLRVDFKNDGTYCSYVYCEEHGWEICDKDGTYQISGNVLATRYEDEEGVDVGGGTILSISDNTLILEGTLEEGSQYKCVYTFKRIK